MSGANLQAVDGVVKIVRELDRYHGFAGADEGATPRPPGLALPAIAPLALDSRVETAGPDDFAFFLRKKRNAS
jgi:hypothetical protein